MGIQSMNLCSPIYYRQHIFHQKLNMKSILLIEILQQMKPRQQQQRLSLKFCTFSIFFKNDSVILLVNYLMLLSSIKESYLYLYDSLSSNNLFNSFELTLFSFFLVVRYVVSNLIVIFLDYLNKLIVSKLLYIYSDFCFFIIIF